MKKKKVVFIKRLYIFMNDVNNMFLIQKDELKLINFFFLGRKYENFWLLKFYNLLNTIYGISLKRYILFFISYLGYCSSYLIIFLEKEEMFELQNKMRDLLINYELQKVISRNYEIKEQLGLYQGERHKFLLPSRGQRTKSNAGTLKQKRKKLISFKKQEEKNLIRIRKHGRYK